MKLPAVKKLPSGSYFVQLRLGGKSISITDVSEREVKRRAQLVKAEYLAGKMQPEEERKELTLSQAIDGYIESKSNILSPTTIRGYRTIQRTRFKDFMTRNVYDIKESEWVELCNREAAYCSAKTLSNAWRFVSAAVRAQTMIRLPEVRLPQIAPNEHGFLDAEQIVRFVEASKGDPYQIPALLALSSLRRSEIYGLQWEHIDLNKRRINVCRSVVPDENSHFVIKKEMKNRSSARVVPIFIDELFEALNAVRQPCGQVVQGNPDSLLKAVNRICARAGVPEVGVHGLRHSFASLAYHLRVPEQITMEIGGWSDIQTMRKIYTHISKSDVDRYSNALGDFFKKK